MNTTNFLNTFRAKDKQGNCYEIISKKTEILFFAKTQTVEFRLYYQEYLKETLIFLKEAFKNQFNKDVAFKFIDLFERSSTPIYHYTFKVISK